MEEFWEKKVNEVVRISKEMGYEELNKEFWMNKPAILISFIIDVCKSHVKILNNITERIEGLLKIAKEKKRE